MAYRTQRITLLPRSLVYYTRISQMEEMHRARNGERAQSFCALSRSTACSSQISNLEALQTLFFGGVYIGFINRHDWLTPLVTGDSITRPSPIPRNQGSGTEPSNQRVGFPGDQPPTRDAFPIHVINIIKHTFIVLKVGNAKGLRSSGPETGKDQIHIYICYYKSQYHTQLTGTPHF